LVGLLYDHRYAAAGPIAVVICLIQIPVIIGLTYDQAALAAGDSRNYFYTIALRAIAQTTCFIVGAHYGGLIGALIGQGAASLTLYSVTIWLARKFRVWDPLHDAGFAAISLLLGSAVLYLNLASIESLF
jgi:O-antigen/teichoic acid export membrane protein